MSSFNLVYGASGMNKAKTASPLRSCAVVNSVGETFEIQSGRAVSAVVGLMAVASFSGAAEAQQSSLPPVTVEPPVARPHPAQSKPTADQVRARNALRRAAQRSQPAADAPVPFPNAGARRPEPNPYVDKASPSKIDQLNATGQFPYSSPNTTPTVTVL